MRQGVPACSRVKVTDSGSGGAREETRMPLGTSRGGPTNRTGFSEVWRQSLRDHFHADTGGHREGVRWGLQRK